MRIALRTLLWSLAAVLLVLATALGLVVAALGTEAGTRQSLALLERLLPELSFEGVEGDWLDGLSMAALRYRDDSVDISLTRLSTRLNGAALFAGQVRLPQLTADTLSIAIAAGEENDEPLLPLPTVATPIPLIISELTLRRLVIITTGTPFELNDLATRVQWLGTRLRYADARARFDQWQAQATGTIALRDAYPLELHGRLVGPELPQALHLSTSGDLQQLEIEASLGGEWPLRGNGWVRLLDDDLPLQATVTLAQPVRSELAGEPFAVTGATLTASGNLNAIAGELVAEVEEPRYRRSRLQLPLQWTPERLHTQPRLALGNGQLNADCTLGLDEPYVGQCDGEIRTVSLTPWLGGIEGEISSPLQLALQLQDGPALQLALPAFDGVLAGHPLRGELALASADASLWQLTHFEARTEGNQLSASGQLSAGDDNRLRLSLRAGALEELLPALAGSLQLDAELNGSWSEPSVAANFNGSALRYGDMAIDRVDGELELPRLGLDAGRVHLALAGLHAAGLEPLSATLRADGQRRRHRLRLDATQSGSDSAVRLRCDGALADDFGRWQLQCPQLDGALAYANRRLDWQLREALALEWQREPMRLALQPFCLDADGAELCLRQALRWSGDRLQPFAAHARNLPLRWVDPWLPNRLRATNASHANLELTLHGGAPLRLEAALDASGSEWRWRGEGGRQSLALERLRANLTLDDRQLRLDAVASAPGFGALEAGLTVAEPRGQRRLDGAIDIRALQLARLDWLLEGADLTAGQIDGRIGIGGVADAPSLDGRLALRGGELRTEILGEEAVREIAVDLRFDQQQANFDGSFRLGAGGGTLGGDSRWQGDEWQLQARLDANQLAVAPLPESEVVLSPRLTLDAGPAQLRLAGEVRVERAGIHIEELPPETIAVSPDTEVIGREVPPQPVQQLSVDLRLDLGDHFHFAGFGADVDLGGRLRLHQEPGQALQADGQVRVTRGRYRAYGQRLQIREGTFFFSGPYDNPELNLEALREMAPTIQQTEMEVGLRITGPLQNPEARLFSKPSMPESDIAYYLLTGRAPPLDGAAGGFSAGGTLLSLGLMGGEDQAAKLAERFGISDLQIGTAETAKGSEAEVSGYLTPKLYVRYGAGLEDQGNSITFQYRLTPRLLIEAISGVDDALDLLYTFTID